MTEPQEAPQRRLGLLDVRWRLLRWTLVAILAALVAWLALRAYISPTAIIDFANSRLC